MKKQLTKAERDDVLSVLRARFEKNMERHKGVDWKIVESRLDADPAKLWSLAQMEESGGEPDVIGRDKKSGEITFCDCAAESPKARRSLCYDRNAWESRKANKPAGNAIDAAKEMGVDLLTEDEYSQLQKLGNFDEKTSSWIQTPQDVRSLGGALFADHRFGRTFVYHNGAESYYAARGFRGILKV